MLLAARELVRAHLSQPQAPALNLRPDDLGSKQVQPVIGGALRGSR